MRVSMSVCVCVCVDLKNIPTTLYEHTDVGWFGWFLCLMAYQLFFGYLMPKPFSKKNSSGTI